MTQNIVPSVPSRMRDPKKTVPSVPWVLCPSQKKSVRTFGSASVSAPIRLLLLLSLLLLLLLFLLLLLLLLLLLFFF